MAEKVKTPTTKATTTGGAKTPPKDPAALVAQKMAAADAAEKGPQSQLGLAPSGSGAARHPKAGDPKMAEPAPKAELPPLPPDDVLGVYDAAAAAVPPAFLQPADDDDDDEPAEDASLALEPGDEAVVTELMMLEAPADSLLGEIRHKQGTVLVAAYYSGNRKRLQHGAKVMQIAAMRLGIAVSELYRAVKFAQKYPDYDAYRRKYPTDPWTTIKDRVKDKPKSSGPKKNAWSARISKFNEICDLMKEELAELRKHVAPAALLELSNKAAEVTKLLGQESDQLMHHDKLVAENERMKLMLAEAIEQGWNPGKNPLDIEVEATRRLEAAYTPADSSASDEPAEEPATT